MPEFDPRRILWCWVPGKVRRQDNGPQGGWRKKAGYRKAWQHRVALHLTGYRSVITKIDPRAPKTIRLHASVFNLFDIDGLYAALKPIPDALVKAGIIHSDRPRAQSGHDILRFQKICRQAEGVVIEVLEGVDL